jgi:hypothetical protein
MAICGAGMKPHKTTRKPLLTSQQEYLALQVIGVIPRERRQWGWGEGFCALGD